MYLRIIRVVAITLVVFVHSTYAQDILRFGNLPSDPINRELDNVGASSEAAQGIATSSGFVFYSNVHSVFRMNGTMSNTDRSINITQLDFAGVRCNHVGGIDAFGFEIYVAVDKCSDSNARLVVLSESLQFRRSARLPPLGNAFPWVAINPQDDHHFYTVSSDKRSLVGFSMGFQSGEDVFIASSIEFVNHPDNVLAHFWTQGGDFSSNGLFLRVVDDAKDEDSTHTGVWIYEINREKNSSDTANRVGFINIQYDPDVWAPDCGFSQCHRSDELEDLDVNSLSSGPFSSSIHVVMLSNELGQDDVSVRHFSAGDFDLDGIDDLNDNCFRLNNPLQVDLDMNRVGLDCDSYEVGRVVIPTLASLI